MPWHKDGLKSINVNKTLIFVSLWVSLKHLFLLKSVRNYGTLYRSADWQIGNCSDSNRCMPFSVLQYRCSGWQADNWSDSNRCMQFSVLQGTLFICRISALFFYLYVIIPRTFDRTYRTTYPACPGTLWFSERSVERNGDKRVSAQCLIIMIIVLPWVLCFIVPY